MLERRLIADELMDAADLDEATYVAVVHDLARVNRVTMAYRPTLDFLRRVAEKHDGERPIRILDVGFGDGDMLRRIAAWAAQRDIAVELVGVDLNPRSLAAARDATPASASIDFRIGDYAELASGDPGGDSGGRWDLVISNLVAHHMTGDELIAFLRFMEAQARLGWLVNDLHRHAFAYLGYPPLAKLLGAHRIVQHDGRMSIARAYRPGEWPPILAQAGVRGARIYRAFPFRLCAEKIR